MLLRHSQRPSQQDTSPTTIPFHKALQSSRITLLTADNSNFAHKLNSTLRASTSGPCPRLVQVDAPRTLPACLQPEASSRLCNLLLAWCSVYFEEEAGRRVGLL